MNMNDKKNQTIAGAVIIILVLGAWFIGRTQTKTPADDAASNSGISAEGTKGVSATPSVRARGESVTVGDQPAGSLVRITSVTLPQIGWVAIRDNTGRVLGAGRFDTGTSESVDVELLRNTVAGEKYQVLLYADDGDMLYDLHKDSLVMNADASVAGTMFTALHGD
jgi:hypothetical protein